MSEPARVLVVRELRKVYVTGAESVTVLRGVDLSLEQGRTLVISGQSGCGKTTLLNLLGGLDHPSSGSVEVAGRDIGGLREEELSWFRNRTLGFIFQFHYLLKDFTALENVMMPARIAGLPLRSSRARAASLLGDVGLGERLRHFPHELSGGERQRVAVARALMNEPSLILADEPTGSLDEQNASAVADVLLGVVERHRTSMVLVTHEQSLRRRGHDQLVLEAGVVRKP